MEIKKIATNSLDFIIKRFIEVLGVSICLAGFLLLVSLITYSPDDPNFIFPENSEIKNLLGFKGSFISDLFFQSMGFISILFSITLFVTGINIVKTKQIFLLIENLFFTILYSLIGSLFLSIFFKDSFWLSLNGNGGFIGKFLEVTFLGNLINSSPEIFYYLLIIFILILFLFSINFKISFFLNFLKNIFRLILEKKEKIKNYDHEISLKNNNDFSNIDTYRVQENLPFSKSSFVNKSTKIKFILPSVDLLKLPEPNERKKSPNDSEINSEFLEKILLDFGVEGKIKKVSHGPVVTLNEFEPAAGIKVSKIINLSEDIARNTSSESARISTIPGRNTIGIELPNLSRENVYLSEILAHTDFSKKKLAYRSLSGKIFLERQLLGILHLCLTCLLPGQQVLVNQFVLIL